MRQSDHFAFGRPKQSATQKQGQTGLIRGILCVAATGLVLAGYLAKAPQVAGDEPEQRQHAVAQHAEPVVKPAEFSTPTPVALPKEIEVTRGDNTLLDLAPASFVRPRSYLQLTDQPISEQLRSPVRLTRQDAYAFDLNTLVQQTLAGLGLDQSDHQVLKQLVVKNLAEGATDENFALAVAAAAAREEFPIPSVLQTPQGGLDAPALLHAIVTTRFGESIEPVSEIPQDRTHVLHPNESLAGLAMTYYGDPLEFGRIAAANGPMLAESGGFRPGATLIIPSP